MTGDQRPGAPGALYLHIPFCTSRCPYCDFAIQVGSDHLQEPYLEALEAELDWLAEATTAVHPLSSVYLGGGTPSMLRPALLERLLDRVRARFPMGKSAELTIEANPEGVAASVVSIWRNLGINRVSLGVQSLEDEALRGLGRSHDSRQAELAMDAVLEGGIANLSCDLIYAIPGQGAEAFERTLRRVLAHQPAHVSCYELTVEPGTALARGVQTGTAQAPSEEDFLEQRRLADGLLAAAGLRRYEVSNYARPGLESRHNLNYWEGRAYLAAGCGAHGFVAASHARRLGFGGTGSALRYWHMRGAATYIRSVAAGHHGVRHQEWLGAPELALERLACGLRLRRGVTLGSAAQLALAGRLAGAGYLEMTGSHVAATDRGIEVLDRLTLELASV